MTEPIPEDWLKKVTAVLASRDFDRIEYTLDCIQGFQSDFPAAPPPKKEISRQLLRYLRRHGHELTGCPKVMDYPEGDTWEFFFTCLGRDTYGKILLSVDKQSILILSAHLPRKGNKLSCERG